MNFLEFISGLNSTVLKAEADKQKVGNRLVKKDGRVKLVLSAMSGVKIDLPESMNIPKQIIMAAQQQIEQAIYREIPDHLTDERVTQDMAKTQYEELPEFYNKIGRAHV